MQLADDEHRLSSGCHHRINCRTFDFDWATKQCRLYEGAVTTGQLVASQISRRVGSIRAPDGAYQSYGQSCAQCRQSRYLVCSVGSCRCPPRSFWKQLECANQRYENDPCQQLDECRTDLNNLSCSAENLCRRKCLVFP